MSKLVAEVKKGDVHLKEAFRIIDELKMQISKQDLIIIEQAKLLAYYQNPHSPPSHNSLPSRKRKSDGSGTAQKTGPQKGTQGHLAPQALLQDRTPRA